MADKLEIGLVGADAAGQDWEPVAHIPAQRGIEQIVLAALCTEPCVTLQAHLPKAHIVKAFNTVFFLHLAELSRPHGAKDRSALPIAGNNIEAKARVQTLLDEIGFDTVDLGQLAEGWRIQTDTPAYVSPYAAYPQGEEGEDFAAAMERLAQGARSADASIIARLTAEAKRYRDH